MNIKSISIRKIALSEKNRVVVQSMTNTPTEEVNRTIEQALAIAECGGEIVRISAPTLNDVENIRQICAEIRKRGYDFPIVADVHFNPKIAEMLTGIVDKIRINPGNFTDKSNKISRDFTDEECLLSLSKMRDQAKPLLEKCKKEGTAIRIGVNQGSLAPRVVARYGYTPLALAKSAMEWVEICEELDYDHLVFSLKSSNVYTMVKANKLFVQEMQRRGVLYPLHLGVTEAGYGLDGRVKSAVGIGSLLLDDIGSTIRVSLTESPVNEIPFAQHIAAIPNSEWRQHYHIENRILHYNYHEKNYERWIAEVSAVAGYEHFKEKLMGVELCNPLFTTQQNRELIAAVEQACRIRISKTEIISCPTCSRTDYDIEKVIEVVNRKFSHYPGLKIAVMGCMVNGPGEMADADYGIIGAKNNKVAVYQGKSRMSSLLPLQEGIDLLEKMITSYYSMS